MAVKPVKYYNSTMTGAPVLSGQAGKLTDLLKACLVDGFNQKTLTSLSVTSEILNGALTAHGFSVDQVIKVTGANEATLNGEWTIVSATADAFTASATGVSNVTGTGTIVAIVAPLGWETMSNTTNIRAFRSSDNDGNGHWYRFVDTTTTYCTPTGYVSMTDGDNGIEPFPVAGTAHYWYKSGAADASARAWAIVADSKMVYMQIAHYSNPYTNVYMMGEFPSTIPGYVYNSVLLGANSNTQLYNILSSSGEATGAQATYFPRAWTQVGAPVAGGDVIHYYTGRSASWSAGYYFTTPLPVTNDFLFTTAIMYQTGLAQPICEALPGLYGTPMYYSHANLAVIDNIIGLEGRRLVAFRCDASGNGGTIYFDLTGPWR